MGLPVRLPVTAASVDPILKALLFDLGNVIIGLDFGRAYRTLAGLTQHGADEIPKIISRANLAGPYERGELSNDEFHKRFCAALDLDLAYEPFEDLWGDMFMTEPFLEEHFFEGLGRRYRLLLLSNTNDIHYRFLRERYPMLRHFDDFVLSYEVGTMKPDAKIYNEAIRRAGVAAKEYFFVDDKQINVDAARQAGIDAVRFESRDELERQLRDRGVQWD